MTNGPVKVNMSVLTTSEVITSAQIDSQVFQLLRRMFTRQKNVCEVKHVYVKLTCFNHDDIIENAFLYYKQ